MSGVQKISEMKVSEAVKFVNVALNKNYEMLKDLGESEIAELKRASSRWGENRVDVAEMLFNGKPVFISWDDARSVLPFYVTHKKDGYRLEWRGTVALLGKYKILGSKYRPMRLLVELVPEFGLKEVENIKCSRVEIFMKDKERKEKIAEAEENQKKKEQFIESLKSAGISLQQLEDLSSQYRALPYRVQNELEEDDDE